MGMLSIRLMFTDGLHLEVRSTLLKIDLKKDAENAFVPEYAEVYA